MQGQQREQQREQQQSVTQLLSKSNEATWLQMGSFAERLGDVDRAFTCYESALRNNANSTTSLNSIAGICRVKELYPKAIEYFQRILNIEGANGEVWGAIGHCNLMMDELQQAYNAYQQALYHLPNPKDPKLWYGIGILYDRYGSFEHAEEAFTSVIGMDPDFEKANEIYFRLGIIYKQHQKYDTSLECFRYILHNPPKPLTEHDIYFQIGHVYEQKKEYESARDSYQKVLDDSPNHAKILQQLGWLYHQETTGLTDQDAAIIYLTKSIESDINDAQTWYILGRAYMSQQKFIKAYDAYQQAVYRDGRNPTFWCSIGVLYYKIQQYPDALDAYTRAIHLNPYIAEVWYDLGTLYESCNSQFADALDAYKQALELDPNSEHIKATIDALEKNIKNGTGSAAASGSTGAAIGGVGQIKGGAPQTSDTGGAPQQIYHGPMGPSKEFPQGLSEKNTQHRRPSVGQMPGQLQGGLPSINAQNNVPSNSHTQNINRQNSSGNMGHGGDTRQPQGGGPQMGYQQGRGQPIVQRDGGPQNGHQGGGHQERGPQQGGVQYQGGGPQNGYQGGQQQGGDRQMGHPGTGQQGGERQMGQQGGLPQAGDRQMGHPGGGAQNSHQGGGHQGGPQHGHQGGGQYQGGGHQGGPPQGGERHMGHQQNNHQGGYQGGGPQNGAPIARREVAPMNQGGQREGGPPVGRRE